MCIDSEGVTCYWNSGAVNNNIGNTEKNDNKAIQEYKKKYGECHIELIGDMIT